MSDLRVNIRILYYHFKITNDWKFIVDYNKFHKGLPDGLFSVYDFRPFKKD
jgi:hypothetical protein